MGGTMLAVRSRLPVAVSAGQLLAAAARDVAARRRASGSGADRQRVGLAAALGFAAVAAGIANNVRLRREVEEYKGRYRLWNWQWDQPSAATRQSRRADAGAAEAPRPAVASGAALKPVADAAAAKEGDAKPAAERPSRQLLLIRHGQYANVEREGDELHHLTPLGCEQADITGRRLSFLLKDKDVVAIRHSNMLRAKQTAQIISKYLPEVPMHEDPDLAEGVPQFPSPGSQRFSFSLKQVADDCSRIERAFRRYFHRAAPSAAATGRGQQGRAAKYEVVVCHGTVIRYFFCRALQFPDTAWLRLATYNCGITWLGFDAAGCVSAREFGNVGHIPANKVTYL